MPEIRHLIADNHKLFRLGLRQLLKKQKAIAVVGEAATGFEAAALAHDLKPDIVLMDISMPRSTASKPPAASWTARPTVVST